MSSSFEIRLYKAALTGIWSAEGRDSEGVSCKFADWTSDATAASALAGLRKFLAECNARIEERERKEREEVMRAREAERAERARIEARKELADDIVKIDECVRKLYEIDVFAGSRLGKTHLSALRTHIATVTRLISEEQSQMRSEFRRGQ